MAIFFIPDCKKSGQTKTIALIDHGLWPIHFVYVYIFEVYNLVIDVKLIEMFSNFPAGNYRFQGHFLPPDKVFDP